jgi:hypothetical protein
MLFWSTAMTKSKLSVFLALAFAAAASYADTLACAAPVLPAYSTTNHEIRRVARDVKHFRACQDAAAPYSDVVEINRRSAEVEGKLEQWLAATLNVSQGQRASQRRLSFVDIDRIERGQSPRNPRPVRRAPAQVVPPAPTPAS